jgi:hypothetical protein
MSSTVRKIEGWVDGIVTTRKAKDIVSVHLFAHKHTPDMVRATTIIGGKALTQEEHEAEFQRRAKAMVGELFDFVDGHGEGANSRIWNRIAANHGIQLP